MEFSLEERLWMKQMQIYVSMPSFNIMESKDSDRTRAQLDACLCVYGCQRVHAFPNICVHVCVCAWEWGGALSVLGYVCLFKAVFAFQGCCCSVIKRRSTKGERREKRGKAIILQRQLFVS